METISRHFSTELGVAFAKALPALRKNIGSTQFRPSESSFGVAGNTFRAYRGWSRPPSEVYRLWAKRTHARLDPSSLARQLSCQKGFDIWHKSLADSLQRHWVKAQGGPLSFAHQHKLIDLFVKWLSAHDFGCMQLSASLVSHANCALDSQTLRKLNECVSMALPLSNPSMGDIHSRHTYAFCQGLIDSFATYHGGTRLLFDYYAWRRGGGG
jgi:hypothetical protein